MKTTNAIFAPITAAALALSLTFAALSITACDNGGGSPPPIITGTAPAITTTTLPGGTVGLPYSQALAASGDAPITWTLENGALPTGLTLANGTISGTPTAANTFNFTVKAANAAGNDTKPLAITIAAVNGGIPPAITTTALPGGTVGLPYSQALAASGDAPITWILESGALPNGLTLANGTISGTPQTANTYNFTVKAANAAGNDTKPLAIVIVSSYNPTVPREFTIQSYFYKGHGDEMEQYLSPDITIKDKSGGNTSLEDKGIVALLQTAMDILGEGSQIIAQRRDALEKLIDRDRVSDEARQRVEETGIIFIDETDKIAIKGERSGGPDVSREGVQRDILPIVEGATVSKPSDLIPELQGRFLLREELDSLGKDDFLRILTEPKNALTRPYTELLATENIELEFTQDAIVQLAALAAEVNSKLENIGARRLHTIMEALLEELSFDAPDIAPVKIQVTVEYVNEKLADIVKDQDLGRYML
jgi:hypothetical protein